MKIIFTLILILSLVSVSALDWPFGKTQYCTFGAFNTSFDCDVSWCNVVLTNQNQTCNYNLTESICKCIQIITLNLTTILNSSDNSTNITSITSIISDTSLDSLKKELKDYSDNQTRLLRDSMLDRIENKTFTTTYTSDNSNQSSVSGYVWIIISIILMGGLFAISQSKKSDRWNTPQDAVIQNNYKYKKNFTRPAVVDDNEERQEM